MTSTKEFLDVVDKNNKVIGKDTREKVHNSKKWHRGIHVFVFNPKGELLVEMRSAKKDKFPNTYDCSISEHVQSGETFEHAALRGLWEELDISNVKVKKLLKFRMNYGPNDNMISALFECKWKGSIRSDIKEVKNVRFMPIEKVKGLLKKDKKKLAPWAAEILKWYFKMPSKVEELK